MKKRKIVLGLVIASAIVTNISNAQQNNEKTVPTMATKLYTEGKPDATRGFFYGKLIKETIKDNKAEVIFQVAEKQSALVSHCVNVEALVNTCYYDTLDKIEYSALDAQGNLLISFTLDEKQIKMLANDKNYRESFCRGDEPLNDLVINGR